MEGAYLSNNFLVRYAPPDGGATHAPPNGGATHAPQDVLWLKTPLLIKILRKHRKCHFIDEWQAIRATPP